ncbi:MAG TPA: hypothetical protein VLY24_14160 [Bryobacteraceae bacterium]|nr:hypothetical protein [Bryobacteraceae bacterium]
MKHRKFLSAAAVLTTLAGSAMPAMAENKPAVPATVGPVTAAITQFNYDESGAGVNGFLIGTNTLLVFLQPVCGGVGSLGAVNDSVTYSGIAQTFPSGFQTVIVTSYKDGAITYPPAAPPKPAAYAVTAGTIKQLNYGEAGFINGFVFAPSSGNPVFVDIGEASATLTPLLTMGAAVSVAGVLEAPPACAPSGAIAEVDATALTIGTKTHPIGGNR